MLVGAKLVAFSGFGDLGSVLVGAKLVAFSGFGDLGSVLVGAKLVGFSGFGDLGSVLVGAKLVGFSGFGDLGSVLVGAKLVGFSGFGDLGSVLVGASLLLSNSVVKSIAFPFPSVFITVFSSFCKSVFFSIFNSGVGHTPGISINFFVKLEQTLIPFSSKP